MKKGFWHYAKWVRRLAVLILSYHFWRKSGTWGEWFMCVTVAHFFIITLTTVVVGLFKAGTIERYWYHPETRRVLIALSAMNAAYGFTIGGDWGAPVIVTASLILLAINSLLSMDLDIDWLVWC